MSLDNLSSYSDIQQAFNSIFTDSIAWLSGLSASEFTAKEGDKWSIAEEFEHVILSAAGIATALKDPKTALSAFGTPNRPVRTLLEVKDRYEARLAALTTPLATRFSPGKYETFDLAKMTSDWSMVGEKIASRLNNWTEKELDSYLLPHPLMGRLILREMLFFTLFHTTHHLESMKAKSMG